MRRARFLTPQFKRILVEARRLAKLNGIEVCGLILDNGLFLELVQTKNKSRHGGGFSFYFSEVRAIRKLAGLCAHEIVGTFHSHPAGLPEPGPGDLRNAVDDSLMLIFDVLGRSARLWHVKDQRARHARFSLI